TITMEKFLNIKHGMDVVMDLTSDVNKLLFTANYQAVPFGSCIKFIWGVLTFGLKVPNSLTLLTIQAVEKQWESYRIIVEVMDDCARADERLRIAGKTWASMTKEDRNMYVEYFGCIFEFFGIVTSCVRRGKF